MSDQLTLIDPKKLDRNPENPRLIFRQEDLDALQNSIARQGILVPLTVYKDGRKFYILDGERRWMCARKLALTNVPVIIQPKPTELQNIMMMFAIHNARRDWDPLPTALKLEDLETYYEKTQGRKPNESELAELASMTRGEVRRLRKLLALPKRYRRQLLNELKKPRSKQKITVDHVLEASTGAAALRKRGIVTQSQETKLLDVLIAKFKSKVIDNTVAPRKLSVIARAVDRGDLPMPRARRITKKLIEKPDYSIDDAYEESVAQIEVENAIVQIANRLADKLEALLLEDDIGERTITALKRLLSRIKEVI